MQLFHAAEREPPTGKETRSRKLPSSPTSVYPKGFHEPPLGRYYSGPALVMTLGVTFWQCLTISWCWVGLEGTGKGLLQIISLQARPILEPLILVAVVMSNMPLGVSIMGNPMQVLLQGLCHQTLVMLLQSEKSCSLARDKNQF